MTLQDFRRAAGRIFFSLVLTACVGSVDGRRPDGDPGGGGEQGGGREAAGGAGGAGVTAPAVPARPLRRLTRTEFNNTLRDLLGDKNNLGDRLPGETKGSLGFLQATDTSDATFGAFSDIAETLAASATTPTNFSKLLPCSSASSPADACAQTFISDFGRRAFRRPLAEVEKADFLALYQQVRKEPGADFASAIRITMEVILQSPEVLYHWEVGSDEPTRQDELIKLGPYELASRLSYFIWRSMPDDALLTSAAQGDLSSPTGLVEQTKRLLDDPKAAAGMTDFFSQLLDLKAVLYTQKEASRHPDFTQARKDAAYAASMQFITHVVLENKDDKNSLATLFTAPYAFVNQAMAPLYGLTDVRGGQLRKVDLPADQRAGLLTQPAFLAGHAGPADGASATPIKRGREIRSAVLCQAIPPPKENIVPKPSSGATTRQRLSEHASDPGCRSCHALMDPLGFAFESYDVTGAFRTKEGTVTIDTSGTLGGLEDGEKNFAGAVDLMKSVAASPEALDCAAQSLIRFATSREESDNESSAIVSALPEGNRSVRELVLAIVTSRGFTHRSPNAQEKQ